MATLTIRQPGQRDVADMRHVRQRRVTTARPWSPHDRLSAARRTLSLMLPGRYGPTEAAVAMVDDELCAYALFERSDDRFCWEVLELAAGSPRVNATDEVSVELWSALLEYGIAEAGAAGARRLYAYVPPNSPAIEGFGIAGFAGYAHYYLTCGRIDSESRKAPEHVRRQHNSDLWSIHQLYHRVTPRPVQFAEALTSDAWITDQRRIPLPGKPKSIGYVVETLDGIGAYCRIEFEGEHPVLTVMATREFEDQLVDVAFAALRDCETEGDEIMLVLAGYQQEFVSRFLDSGLWMDREVVAMVRHTTVPMVVHPRFASAEAAAARQPAKGVVTLPTDRGAASRAT